MILKSVPQAGFIELAAFAFGGPCGIVVSIVIYEKFFHKNNNKEKYEET